MPGMWQVAARALLGALVLVLSGALDPAHAKGLSEGEVKTFKERASEFFLAGRYDEALAVAEKWAKAAEKAEGGKRRRRDSNRLGRRGLVRAVRQARKPRAWRNRTRDGVTARRADDRD